MGGAVLRRDPALRALDTHFPPFHSKSSQFSMDAMILHGAGRPAQLWSADRPHLYLLTLSLVDARGSALEHEACQVGFRTTSVRNKKLVHNGWPILIRGRCGHFEPRVGAVVRCACRRRGAQRPV